MLSCYGPYLPTDSHYASLWEFYREIKSLGEDIVNLMAGRSVVISMRVICTSMLCLEISRQLKNPSANNEFTVVNLGSEFAMSIAELAGLIASFSPNTRVSVRVLGNQINLRGSVCSIRVPDMSYSKELGIYRNRVTPS